MWLIVKQYGQTGKSPKKPLKYMYFRVSGEKLDTNLKYTIFIPALFGEKAGILWYPQSVCNVTPLLLDHLS